jgi:hypothetical protein
VGLGAAWLCVGSRLTAPAAMPSVAIRARLGGFGRRCVPMLGRLLCASADKATVTGLAVRNRRLRVLVSRK